MAKQQLADLVSELEVGLGPRWDTRQPKPDASLIWTWLEDDTSSFISIVGTRGEWNAHELRIVADDKDRVIGWRLFNPTGVKLMHIDKWENLREAIGLSTEYLMRQARVERALRRRP